MFHKLYRRETIYLRSLKIICTGARWFVNLVIPSEEPYDQEGENAQFFKFGLWPPRRSKESKVDSFESRKFCLVSEQAITMLVVC